MARSSIRRSCCLFSSRTRWTASRCPCTETAPRSGIGSSSRTTAPGSSSRCVEAYNIGGGEEATNLEITNLVLEHTGADESLIRPVEDRAGHDRRYSLDTTKARTE